MTDSSPTVDAPPASLVWDWPLRIWHWAFAATITGSLVTGLSDDIALMDWHLRLGYGVLGLLLFRLGWAVWGGRYARLSSFATSPSRFLAHFRGAAIRGAAIRGAAAALPRTAPGIVLAVLMLAAVAGQALSGLYTSDEIFTEGPLAGRADDEVVDALSWLHRRLFWVVLTLIAVHLLAHFVYALRRDPTPLSMFTGRKRLHADPVRHLPWRALATAAAAGAVVWLALA